MMELEKKKQAIKKKNSKPNPKKSNFFFFTIKREQARLAQRQDISNCKDNNKDFHLHVQISNHSKPFHFP